MSAAVHCRPMREQDFAAVISFYMEYYNAEGDAWTEETVLHRIRQVYDSPDAYCLVAEENGAPIAFAMGRFQQYYDLVAYDLVEIVVRSSHQNQGIGSEFLIELERRVKSLGAAMVQLDAVNDERHHRFYGRLGYKDVTNLVPKCKFL